MNSEIISLPENFSTKKKDSQDKRHRHVSPLLGLWVVCFEIRPAWITAAFSSPSLRRAVATLDEWKPSTKASTKYEGLVDAFSSEKNGWKMYFPIEIVSFFKGHVG